MPRVVSISTAVEGLADEAVVRRLVHDVGGAVDRVFRRGGRSHLRQRVANYNQAAARFPWIVLADLENDAECAPSLVGEWLPHPARLMCFRIAVRTVEPWLMGDRAGIARFLGVPAVHAPVNPETLRDPKGTMVSLAAKSRSRAIREDMVPRLGSGVTEGPAYASRLVEFATLHWRPDAAAAVCDSLRRCRERIAELVATASLIP